LFQILTLCPGPVPDGLADLSNAGLKGDTGETGVRGETGGDTGGEGGTGAVRGRSYDALAYGGTGFTIVNIDALSSSSSSRISASVERSEYEFSIEETRTVEEVEDVVVLLASELMLDELDEVDIEEARKEDTDDARSEPEVDVAAPMSCLCARQWMSGMDVKLSRFSRTRSRTSLALGRRWGFLPSIPRMRASR
jgi:hypothetical protein